MDSSVLHYRHWHQRGRGWSMAHRSPSDWLLWEQLCHNPSSGQLRVHILSKKTIQIILFSFHGMACKKAYKIPRDASRYRARPRSVDTRKTHAQNFPEYIPAGSGSLGWTRVSTKSRINGRPHSGQTWWNFLSLYPHLGQVKGDSLAFMG